MIEMASLLYPLVWARKVDEVEQEKRHDERDYSSSFHREGAIGEGIRFTVYKL